MVVVYFTLISYVKILDTVVTVELVEIVVLFVVIVKVVQVALKMDKKFMMVKELLGLMETEKYMVTP